jgi:Asp-tRNA(Asn)/Glu-tRNA(Gln) amidotransferase A subunit family amidase
MARTVRDTALLFTAMCGFDGRDPLSLPAMGEDFVASCKAPLGPMRVAWSPDLGFATVDPEVMRITETVARAFADFGCEVEEASPELGPVDDLFLGLTAPIRAAAVGKYLDDWAPQMDPILVARVRLAETLSATEYERLQLRRTELWQAMGRFFQRYALLLTPTVALSPFPVDAPYPPTEVAGVPTTSPVSWMPFTFPFNLTGHPAISVPAGWTEDGLPVGLQIVGPRLAESVLLRAAAALEAVRPWQHRRPSL